MQPCTVTEPLIFAADLSSKSLSFSEFWPNGCFLGSGSLARNSVSRENGDSIWHAGRSPNLSGSFSSTHRWAKGLLKGLGTRKLADVGPPCLISQIQNTLHRRMNRQENTVTYNKEIKSKTAKRKKSNSL